MPKKNKNPLISNRNPFDEVKALFSKEYGDVNVVRPFMATKILSFIPISYPLATRLNEVASGLPKYLYNAIVNIGVQGRNTRIYMRFPKKIKKEDVKLRQRISQTFCTNDFHSNQIIDILKGCGEKPHEYYGLKEGE